MSKLSFVRNQRSIANSLFVSTKRSMSSVMEEAAVTGAGPKSRQVSISFLEATAPKKLGRFMRKNVFLFCETVKLFWYIPSKKLFRKPWDRFLSEKTNSALSIITPFPLHSVEDRVFMFGTSTENDISISWALTEVIHVVVVPVAVAVAVAVVVVDRAAESYFLSSSRCYLWPTDRAVLLRHTMLSLRYC